MPTETVELHLAPRPGEPLVSHVDAAVVLSPSAYDVPQSATIEWGAPQNLVRVTFNYVDREEAKELPIDEALTLYTGKNSEKLLGLALRLTGGSERVADELARGVDGQIARATRDNQRLNYILVRDALLGILAPRLARFSPLAPA